MASDHDIVARFKKAQDALVVQASDLSLASISTMVQSGAIDVQPVFQRRERWDVRKQSALIESFLLNVPVPPVYLAEEEIGTYTAIDGKQRLRAIADFIGNRLSLRHLDRLADVDGLHFRDLPQEITNALLLRPFLRV